MLKIEKDMWGDSFYKDKGVIKRVRREAIDV
jgi:hypothetical protein